MAHPAAAGMVIVGAGEAGARAALALREAGWGGAVTLLGDEPHAPYERPPLSKSVQHGGSSPPLLSPEALRGQAITLRTGCQVLAIDRAARLVRLADGQTLAYERLLLATGAAPRRLPPLPGGGDERVLYLRTLEDAQALRADLDRARHLVVIGGGFIGLEIAAVARAKGCAVTLVEVGPRLLARAVPAAIAGLVAARHEAAGVRLMLGAGVGAIESAGTGSLVHLSCGTRVACDTVVAGIGALPRTDLAEQAGLAVGRGAANGGIETDERLRTSDERIFAAGDCCAAPHPLYGGRRIRLEAWRNAHDQAAVAARNMMGGALVHQAVPWFWSDQFEMSLQIAGLPDAGTSSVERRDGDARLVFHLDTGGRLVAASGWGPGTSVARDIKLAERLIAARCHPDPAALAQPGFRLKSLLDRTGAASPAPSTIPAG